MPQKWLNIRATLLFNWNGLRKNSHMTEMSRRKTFLVAALVVSGSLLGCRSGGVNPGADTTDRAAPVQLARGGAPSAGASVRRNLNETEVRRAIERYRINKKRAPGPYQLAGADLNGNGKAEAVVLFGGEDWCARTGCSMAVFVVGEFGYRPSFRTVRVRGPVRVADISSNGWRDLIVSTGGGGAPIRRVRLKFVTNGYPRNAMLEPDASPTADDRAENLIKAPAVTPAQTSN